jgi:glycosyltransferase involved in cell wall biosynthesis
MEPKMKKILFDLSACQPLGHIKFHGGGIYGYIVFEKIINIAPEKIVAYWDSSCFMDAHIKDLISSKNIECKDAKFCTFKQAIDDDNIGLIYSPLYREEYKVAFNTNIPFFITVHGLRKLEMNRDPQEIYYANSLVQKIKCLIKKTPLYRLLYNHFFTTYKNLLEAPNVNIITVSQHSMNSLQFFYPNITTNKINVFYSPSTTYKDYEKTTPFSNDKYYLIVSGDRWLKNSFRAMQALDILFSQDKSVDGYAIVTGLPKNNSLIRRLRNRDRFVIKDYVNKDQLESLLKGAYALIYPSLNEGFGYPPLEAMKYGTPVISSPFASITEVCGDAVLYANPYSPAEIAMRILDLNEKKEYEKYSQSAIDRYNFILKKQNSDLQEMVSLLLNRLS